jgi:hypothetical protein
MVNAGEAPLLAAASSAAWMDMAWLPVEKPTVKVLSPAVPVQPSTEPVEIAPTASSMSMAPCAEFWK